MSSELIIYLVGFIINFITIIITLLWNWKKYNEEICLIHIFGCIIFSLLSVIFTVILIFNGIWILMIDYGDKPIFK